MKRVSLFVAVASPMLIAWNAPCPAQATAYSFSSIDVTDFLVTAMSGTAQPVGPPVGGPPFMGSDYGPNLLTNGTGFDGFGEGISHGVLDAPQVCQGAPCSGIPENTFTRTGGSNFTRGDSLITSLSNFGTGTSFQLVAEGQQILPPGQATASNGSFGMLNMSQTFTLSHSSQVAISFLAAPFLAASLTQGTGPAAGAPGLITQIDIRTEGAPPAGPLAFFYDWNYNGSGPPKNGTVISNPFPISFSGGGCESPGSVVAACEGIGPGSSRYDPGTGMFQVDTNSLPSGVYTIDVTFVAEQTTIAAPEPSTMSLLLLGIGLLAWNRWRFEIVRRT